MFPAGPMTVGRRATVATPAPGAARPRQLRQRRLGVTAAAAARLSSGHDRRTAADGKSQSDGHRDRNAAHFVACGITGSDSEWTRDS